MRLTLRSLFISMLWVGAASAADCPAPVQDAALKAYPGAKVSTCKAEEDHGKRQFEVKLVTADAKKLELDISPDGQVLLTEEVVPEGALPAAVLKAFEAKFPKAKARRVEKQTKADRSVNYELAFGEGKARHEATFAADGTFVSEE